jgi:hypothetical protein
MTVTAFLLSGFIHNYFSKLLCHSLGHVYTIFEVLTAVLMKIHDYLMWCYVRCVVLTFQRIVTSSSRSSRPGRLKNTSGTTNLMTKHHILADLNLNFL